jgi:type IV pilus assembly protein PilV
MRSLSMKPLNRKQFVQLNKQQGFSLIEALVAFLILSVGMLGIASLQVLSLKAGSTAVMRTVAVMKVEEMMERIRNNPVQVNGYATASATGVNNGCNDYATYKSCTSAQMVQDDIYHWIEELKNRLPNTGVKASIAVLAPTPGTLPAATVTVTVNWDERSTETQSLESMSYSSSAYICDNTSC